MKPLTGETEEFEEMYPNFIEEAKAEKETPQMDI